MSWKTVMPARSSATLGSPLPNHLPHPNRLLFVIRPRNLMRRFVLLADEIEFEWNKFRIRLRFGTVQLPEGFKMGLGIFKFAEPSQHFSFEEASHLALFGGGFLVRDHFAIRVEACLQIGLRSLPVFVLNLPGRLKVSVTVLSGLYK